MDLVQLRHFTAVAEHGSISHAAAALRLTQPGLTKSVRRLEQELGVRLLARRPRGVEITPGGAALLRHARLVTVQLRDAVAELQAIAGGEVGEIGIGAGPSWLSRSLPVAVARLVAKRPGVRVRVVGGFNDRLMRLLREGELDIVVAAIPEGPIEPELACLPLTHDLLRVITRRGHPLQRGRPTLARLMKYSWVLPGRDVLSRHRLEALFHAKGMPPPRPVIESDSISFILATLRESDCLSFATGQLLLGEEARDIAPLPMPGMTFRRAAGIIHRRRGELSHPARALIAELRSLCEQLEAN